MNSGGIVILAVLTGGLVAFQGPINSQLARLLSHPLQAAFISFSVGTITMLLATLVFKSGFPPMKQVLSIPKILLIGGMLGSIYIIANILFIPRIGVFNMLVSVLVGQVLVSLIVDHFGLFGLESQKLNLNRLLGAGLVIAGIVVINK